MPKTVTGKKRRNDDEDDLLHVLTSSGTRIEQVIQPFVLECEPDTPIEEAARRMHQARCSCIIVVEGDKAVGIWTERDALAIDFQTAVLRGPIREVMSTPVRTVSGQTLLEEVAERFRRERMRHLLVIDATGRPHAVVSQTDLVLNHGIEHYLRLRRVDSVLKRPPLVVDASQALKETARQMRVNSVDAVIVGFGKDDFGIVTERDIVRKIAEQQVDQTTGAVASRPLLTVAGNSSLYRVRNMLVERRVRHIGVTDEAERLIGLLSFSDLIAGMEAAYVQELQKALRERDHALTLSKRSLHLAERVIECSLEGIMVTDHSGIIQSVNPAFSRLTGYLPDEVLGKTPSVLSSGRHDGAFYRSLWSRLKRNGHWQGEIWNRRKNGEVYPELLTITAISDEEGDVTHYAAIFSDITELKQNEERIRNLAYFDPLTGLPNRRLLSDRVSVAIAHARRKRGKAAVLFVDLDRFKRVNDSLGHDVGDRLLREVSLRLQRCIREDDTVSRMGGDEFVLLLSQIAAPDDAVHVARRVLESLKLPIAIEGDELVITTSVGIALYPDDGQTAEELIKNADAAMYRAKDLGRNSFQLYTPAMNARSLEHLSMEAGLRKAIEREEFLLYYQPIVGEDGTGLVGAEALLRWRHPDMGIVPPSDFIPLAEETGLIIPIGEWVLRSVCRQIRAWEAAGHGPVSVALNISARQFNDEDFLARTRAILEEEKIPSSLLVFELTESMLMDDAIDSVRTLQELRRLGIDVAVDDFGTGYSSLSYLKRFPINRLKIDRSFVRGVFENSEDAAIASAVINLAHSLKMQVVAEGIEYPEQMEILRKNGCDFFQGFYFGQPDLPDKLRERYLPYVTATLPHQ